MSDFFNQGWSAFIAAATILGLIACVVLLFIAARVRPMGEDNTTGHVWDEDLRELNNPLPRWWMWLFIATVVFSGIYLALYPGLGSHAGSLGWSSSTEHEAERAKARADAAPVYAGFVSLPFEQLAHERAAVATGERLFANHCAGCHGADARGSKGFPNLADRDWLYGGAPEQITESIAKGRQGTMPPMAAAVGNAEDVKNLANYVLSLSGSAESDTAAQLGRSKFSACAACHGIGGKGNPALGAPNLADKIWLHGWGVTAITQIINNGKHSLMPAHEQRLSADEIRVLGAYVWGLSNPAPTSKVKAAPTLPSAGVTP